MSALQDAVIARLSGDATLLAILTGGVWNRPLKQAGPGNTAAAWAASATGVLHLRPAAVLLDPDEVAHPSGYANRDAFAADRFLAVRLYAEATATGKAELEAADDRIQQLLHTWQTQADGDRWSVKALPDRTGATDSSDFPGELVTMRRFECTALRVVQEVA